MGESDAIHVMQLQPAPLSVYSEPFSDVTSVKTREIAYGIYSALIHFLGQASADAPQVADLGHVEQFPFQILVSEHSGVDSPFLAYLGHDFCKGLGLCETEGHGYVEFPPAGVPYRRSNLGKCRGRDSVHVEECLVY